MRDTNCEQSTIYKARRAAQLPDSDAGSLIVCNAHQSIRTSITMRTLARHPSSSIAATPLLPRTTKKHLTTPKREHPPRKLWHIRTHFPSHPTDSRITVLLTRHAIHPRAAPRVPPHCPKIVRQFPSIPRFNKRARKLTSEKKKKKLQCIHTHD